MQDEGVPSWSLDAGGGEEILHAVLWCRDALDLPVPDGPANPPPLFDHPAPVTWSASDAVRRAAGGQWSEWWSATLTGVGDGMLGRGGFDEPDFISLADRPELRNTVAGVWREARDATRTGGRPKGVPLRDWVRAQPGIPQPILRRVVDDVAFDLGVARERLHGRLTTVRVEGLWWHGFDAGHVVCSPAAVSEPRACEALLRQAFISGLDRTP